jgi:AAA+ superfamily predicted ATPase
LRLRYLQAKAQSRIKPVLFFIDHVDCITTGKSSMSHELINNLIYQLEEKKNNPNFFLIFATDDKNVIDKRILNKLSGGIIEIKKLNQADKEELLEKLLQDYNLKNYEGYPKALAKVLKSDNFSNRDLKLIVQKAKFMQNIECIKDKYFREAIDQCEKDANYSSNSIFGSGI